VRCFTSTSSFCRFAEYLTRLRYDSIKYDLKKIEEVTYDLSIRGLIKPGGAATATESMAE